MNDERERVQENAEENIETFDSRSFEMQDDFAAADQERAESAAKKSPDRKKKYIYIAISIVISFALWLNVVDVQNPDSERIVRNVPLTVRNVDDLDEQDLVITSEINDTISVTIRGRRSDIINVNTSEIRADIDLKGCKEGTNSVRVNVDVPRAVSVQSVSPNGIEVEVEKVINEEKDVEILFEGVLTNDREAVCTDISDEKVKISGVRSLVKTVDKVQAIVNISDLGAESGKYKAELVPVDVSGKHVENVKLSKKTVDVSVMINVAKKAGLTVDTVGRLPDNMELLDISYPKEIEITVPEEKADSIDKITASPVDLSSIVGSTAVDLHLDLPEGVKLSKNQTKPQAVIKVDSINDKTVVIETKNIKITGLDPQMSVSFEKDQVEIAVTAGSEKLKSFSANNIILTIDCKDLKEGSYSVKPAAELTGISDKEAYVLSVPDLTINIDRSEAGDDGEPSGTAEAE